MISALASSSFVSTSGPKMWKIRPLDDKCKERFFDVFNHHVHQGLGPRLHEPRNLTSNKSRRCSQIVSSSLSPNRGHIDSQGSGRENPIGKYSVSPTFESADAFIPEKEISIAKKLGAIYTFMRPYQIYGTILEVILISLFPVQAITDLTPAFFVGLLKTIIPMVLVFVYANGLNEITDVEIDKINKPFLPLASGDLSLTEATAIISISTVVCFLITAALNSLPLSIAIMTIFFGLSAYSIDLPLLRWKKNAVLTAAILSIMKGVVLPLCFFAHAQTYILGKPLMYTKQVWFTVAVMTSFSAAVAVFKDIPDVEGDKLHGVRSASIIYGVEKVFWSSVYVMLATYGAAVIFGATSPLLSTKIIVVLGHVIPAIILWIRARSTNISDPAATLAFYFFLWKLTYAEYLIIPFVH